MTDQPALPPRICRKGHRVALDDGSGIVRYQSYTNKPYLQCRDCAELWRADIRRLALRGAR